MTFTSIAARLLAALFGSALLGSTLLGSTLLGSALLGSALLGSTLLGSAFLGSAFLGSTFLGSALLRSAFLGSALLSTTFLGGFLRSGGLGRNYYWRWCRRWAWYRLVKFPRASQTFIAAANFIVPIVSAPRELVVLLPALFEPVLIIHVGSSSLRVLVPEMSHTSEDHCQIMLVRSPYYFVVTNGSSRLNYGGNSCPGSLVNSVTKWEKRIGSQHRTGQGEDGFHCPDLSRVNPAHLPCSDANQLAFVSINTRIGLDVFCEYPGKPQCAHLWFGRLPGCHDTQS